MALFDSDKFDAFVIEQGVIGFCQEPICLRSGRVSHWYANWRSIARETSTMSTLADFVLDFCFDNNFLPSFFYGVPEGASPLAILTQYKYVQERLKNTVGHPLLMGRREPKYYGALEDRFFIGKAEGSSVLIEDVTTTGDSLLKEIEKLQQIPDITILRALSLLDRNEVRDDGHTVSDAIYSKTGVHHSSLITAEHILPLAYKRLQPGEEIGKKLKQELGDRVFLET